tara:strand:+ start:6424 stop:7371 length:948 start_codon:yes stop_codon:yes gene_type:complete
MNLIDYIKGLQKNDRSILSKSITLIESSLTKDKEKSVKLINHCLKQKHKSLRIGITGTPGVGKSTFIEALGQKIINDGNKVAVLAIDPSSHISNGSILGDKTRMQQLSNSTNAFIRPSPSEGHLGGVTYNTKDLITLCEAAGYNVIIIETVGVGQSEFLVESMTDFYVYLTLSENGDELQYIKKGAFELTDFIIINKSDINQKKANQTKTILQSHLNNYNNKKQTVFTCSALNKTNINKIWEHIYKEFSQNFNNGNIEKKRKKQNIFWFKKYIVSEYIELLNKNDNYNKLIKNYNKNSITNPRMEAAKFIKKLIN